MTDSITFRFQGREYVLPVGYRKDAVDILPPLVAALSEAMFSHAVVEKRRARGEQDPPSGLGISFEARDVLDRFTRTWSRVEYFNSVYRPEDYKD